VIYSVIGRMNRALTLLMCGCIVILTSCDKDNFIGKDLLPDEDFLNSEQIDTFKIITYTDFDDSVVTSQNVFYALGSLDNQRYGKATASIYSQVLLPANNLFFGDAPEVDSVVLTLDYSGYYGDTTLYHSLNVYRMSEPMQSGRNYHSDDKFRHIPVPIGRKSNFKVNMLDSVMLADSSLWEPHLRIPMYNTFGTNIINLDSTILASDTSFLEYLQGIYITPDTSAGYSNAIMYFDMASDISGLRIYYHNSEADSLSVMLPLTGTKCNSFTNQLHPGTDIGDAIMNADTTDGDAFTYVKGFAGARTIVKLPTLTNLQDVSINKAELVLTMTNDGSRYYPAPPKVQLVQLDSTGRNYYYLALYTYELYSSIVDDNFGSTNIGGVAIKTTRDNTGRTVYEYQYNITKHVQEIIEGSLDNNGFALICYPTNRVPNAVTLGGPMCPREDFKPRFTVTYTTINK